MELGVKKVAMSQRLKPKNLTRTFYLDTKKTLDEVPFANEIPQPKPQELLDIQEKNRKQRLLDSLNKIGGRLEDSSLDFINRENFSTAGLVTKLLSKIPVRTGAERVEKITDFTAQKNFMNAFLEYANKKFNGNFSAAADSIGQNRNKIRAIFDRVREAETGTRKGGIGIGTGAKKVSTVPTPKNVIPYTDATTKVKTDKNFLKDKINDFNKNKFYSPTDIGNILGVDVSNKVFLDNLTADLKRFGVANKATTGQMKNFKLGDAVNKITKGYEKKLVKGQRKSQTERTAIDNKLDSELKTFLENFKGATRKISKEEGIYVKNAVEDVGHSLSVKITDKYPKLTKNSNINKINTLTFQDPEVNQKLLEATGYEAKHDSLLKSLNKLVGKKIGPKELEELKSIKVEMNALHNKALTDVKKLAQKNTYFKGQENRLPKIDIKLPKEGQTFKSEDLFVDMSNVNPAFKVGLVDQINPDAKFFKDLTKEQKEIYKRNVLDQTKFNLDKFYTKSGFPKEQVEELKDSLEFGTSSKLGIGTVGTLGLGSTAAAADELEVETSDDFPTGKVAAGAAAAPLATKKGRSIYGKAGKGLLKMLSSPSAALGFGAYELGQGNTKLAGASLLAPEVLSTLAPAGKGILSRAGSILMNPFGKAARAFTPVGLATIGAGAAYDVYKEIERRRALTPEERLEEDIEAQARDDEMMVGAAEGGRIGYSNGSDGTALAIEASLEAFQRYLKAGGKLSYKDFIAVGGEGVSKFFNSGGRVGFADGPDDPKRRTFMKVMAGIASLPILGKFFKPAVPLVKKLSNTTTKMPDWFPNFVDRFINKGIGNKIDADLTEYSVKELPDVKLLKQDNGAIRVEGKNAYNEEYYIDYEPPGVEVVDYNTGKTVKTKGDFVATDTEYRMISPEDYDVDGVNVDEIDDILGGSSTDLEGFAKGTGKTKYTTGQRRIDEADARGASKDESLRADINDPYEGVDGSDFTDD